MKRFGFVINIFLMFAFLFTACSKGTSSKILTSNDAVSKYLSTANNGVYIDDPVPLSVKIDLQNMSASDSGWKQLLSVINTSGKYVALDLSGCSIPGTEFNPDSSFADGKNFIVSLILPDAAVKIADVAENSRPSFKNFVNLSSIPVGKNFTTIGDYAFYGMSMDSVSIPDGVTTIGIFAFYDCKLTSINLPDSVTTIWGMAFSKNQLSSVIIPNSVKSFGANAFSNNQLTDVVISNSISTISSQSFSNNQLASVTIPDGVSTIEGSAFSDNYRLASIIIPDSVISIGQRAFSFESLGDFVLPLTSITIGADVSFSNSRYVPSVEGGFEAAYNNGGKKAGTYTRPNIRSTVWTKQ